VLVVHLQTTRTPVDLGCPYLHQLQEPWVKIAVVHDLLESEHGRPHRSHHAGVVESHSSPYWFEARVSGCAHPRWLGQSSAVHALVAPGASTGSDRASGGGRA